MTMLEQMILESSERMVQDGRCRVCHERDETIEHLVAGCKFLANSEYFLRHNEALMIVAVAWVREYELIGGDMVWYKE